MKKKVVVIGSGFAGISAACFLAKAGFEVTVLEKNAQAGGRARVLIHEGFTFDMGPSWYWMPDVFEHFFQQFDSSVSAHYTLKRLDPSYRVFFGKDDFFDVPADWTTLAAAFEKWEPGAAHRLEVFLAEAEIKYRESMQNMVYKPGLSLREFASWSVLKSALHLDLFTSFKKHAGRFFRHPKVLKILEFPVLFLGATPEKTPALYSLMNFADLRLGTWYPMSGMHQIVKGMLNVAKNEGVEILLEQEVVRIEVGTNGSASRVHTATASFSADVVVAAADYAHVDQTLLEKPWQQYNAGYWHSRTMAPSSLLYYVGLGGKAKNLQHHNLFFDEDFASHAARIYEKPDWPARPLFYLSVPSLTDPAVAPEGHENLFFLIPTAPGLMETRDIADRYFDMVAERTERLTGNAIRKQLIFNLPYGPTNFVQDYHAHKGNAYGLANTLMQTAIFKPSLRSKKVSNLYFAGQLTVPGPGVPPSIISGQVAAKEIIKNHLR